MQHAQIAELERRKKEQIAQIADLEEMHKRYIGTMEKPPFGNEFDELNEIAEEINQKKKQWRRTAKEHHRIMDGLKNTQNL